MTPVASRVIEHVCIEVQHTGLSLKLVPANERQAVSLWEIAIKVSLGKLALLKPYELIIPQQIEENDIELLPIAHNHLNKIIDLPFHHRDPFDRLIIAQAMTEGIPIISPDAAFSQYPIKLIWH